MDKIKYVRRMMARIPVMYEQLMRLHPDGMPSLGLVARFDRVGGSGGGFSSITESIAMKGMALTEMQQEMLKWLDAVYAVYFRLIDAEGKNAPRVQHERKLGVVLKERVFEGKSMDSIRDVHFRSQVSVQYVSKLYGDVVEMVVKEAEKRGLLKALG